MLIFVVCTLPHFALIIRALALLVGVVVVVGGRVNSSWNFTPCCCSVPTSNEGNPCAFLGPPFLNKCSYDGVQAMLSTVLGHTISPPVEPDLSQVIVFEQKDYVPENFTGYSGLQGEGIIYAPDDCRTESLRCPVHFAFHGCDTSLDDLRENFARLGGYLGLAEANHIIMIFPHIQPDEDKNPHGCFDWWGYTNEQYAQKSGVQLSAFVQMAQEFLSPKAFLEKLQQRALQKEEAPREEDRVVKRL